MDTVKRHLSCVPLWVIDRGGDRIKLWDTRIKDGNHVLVRAANQRFWLWRDQEKTAQQIAKALPLKHRGKLTRNSDKTIKFGLTRVYLKEHPERPLTLIVVRRQKEKKPLQFPFYSILRGWQRFFQQAKTVFYTWWRKSKPDKDPPIGGLFENDSGLLTCAN